jgi:hypothetical protein
MQKDPGFFHFVPSILRFLAGVSVLAGLGLGLHLGRLHFEWPILPSTGGPDPARLEQGDGLSVDRPLQRDALVAAPDWDVRVLEVARGEAARNLQQGEDLAPEGMEYLFVRLHVKSTSSHGGLHLINGCYFDVAGERLIRYSCRPEVAPIPFLEAALAPGGEAEGWAAYLVGAGESSLVLIIDEILNLDEDSLRFIALEDGAALRPPPGLKEIQPNNSGADSRDPASLQEVLVTENWEFSILEVARGEQAWKMVQAADPANQPPGKGREYIALRVRARYIGVEDPLEVIDGSFFRIADSAGQFFYPPLVLEPAPRLDVSLLPGGEFEGWVVVQAASGEKDPLLIFEPLFSPPGSERRFISLRS